MIRAVRGAALLLLATAPASWGGCGGEEAVTVVWTREPASDFVAGKKVTAAWEVRGGAEVSATFMRACPEGRPGCEPPPGGKGVDSTHQKGKPGAFTGAITLTPGTWTITVHATVDGRTVTSPSVTRTVRPGVTIAWVKEPPAILTAGGSFSASWKVSGGTSVSATNLRACPVNEPPPCRPPPEGPRLDSPTQRGGMGRYAASLTLKTAGTWLVWASATVGGVQYATQRRKVKVK